MRHAFWRLCNRHREAAEQAVRRAAPPADAQVRPAAPLVQAGTSGRSFGRNSKSRMSPLQPLSRPFLIRKHVDETCPISTEGWTRRVHFVREGGGGGGGGGGGRLRAPAPAARRWAGGRRRRYCSRRKHGRRRTGRSAGVRRWTRTC